MKGIYLAAPHGELIWTGRKHSVIKTRPMDIGGEPRALLSMNLGYGVVRLGKPQEIALADFSANFKDHRISDKERMHWWDGIETFYSYPIVEFTPYKRPRRWALYPGVKTLVESVEWLDAKQTEVTDMPWTISDPPPNVTDDWTEAQIKKCVETANAVLREGGSKTQAIQACIRNAGRSTKALDELEALNYITADEEEEKARQPVMYQENIVIMPEPVVAPARPNALDMLQSRIHKSFTVVADDMLAWGYVTEAERIALSGAIGTALESFIERVAEVGLDRLRGVPLTDEHAILLALKEETEEIEKAHERVEELHDALSAWQALEAHCGGYLEPWEEVKARILARADQGEVPEGEGEILMAKQSASQTPKVYHIGGKAVNLDRLTAYIREQFQATVDGPRPDRDDVWVAHDGVFDEYVIVEVAGEYFRVDFIIDEDGELQFSRRSEWVPVERIWRTKGVATEPEVKEVEGVEEPTNADALTADDVAAPAEERVGFGTLLKQQFGNLLDRLLDREIEPEWTPDVAFKTFEGDGRTWLALWPTNAFMDRDGEIITTKALEDLAQSFSERQEELRIKSYYDYWHVPGSEFGTIHFMGVVGRCLVTLGTFDETPIGNAFKDFLTRNPKDHPAIAPEGWGASHQFLYRAKDRDDGVYEWLDMQRASVLPGSVAANPWNPEPEVMTMLTEKQTQDLKAIGDEVGMPDLVNQIMAIGEQRTKELEGQVAFKEAEPEEKAAETPVVEAEKIEPIAYQMDPAVPIEEVALKVVEALQLGQFPEMLKTLTEQIEGMGKRLAKLESDDEPRFNFFQASRAAETVLKEGDPLAAAGPRNAPMAVSALANSMQK